MPGTSIDKKGRGDVDVSSTFPFKQCNVTFTFSFFKTGVVNFRGVLRVIISDWKSLRFVGIHAVVVVEKAIDMPQLRAKPPQFLRPRRIAFAQWRVKGICDYFFRIVCIVCVFMCAPRVGRCMKERECVLKENISGSLWDLCFHTRRD